MTAPAAPLDFAARRALGIAARKQLARRQNAAFTAATCPTDPLALLADSERGRLPALIAIKRQRMAASPFGFFRGAVPIMAADLACHPHTGLVTQLCGDAHVSNLGAFAGPMDGTLSFDINDFDETIQGPFEWDLKRLAASLILAGREAGIKKSARQEAVLHFAQQYRRSMAKFSTLPILELERYRTHRIARINPMPAILAQAQRSTPVKTLTSLTEPAHSKNKSVILSAARSAKSKDPDASGIASADRRFRANPPLLTPLSSKEKQTVLASLGDYARTLQPERRHFLAQYRAVDVAFKVVGTGSVGLRDYCLYLEGSHSRKPDPLFLQIKEEAHSAYAPYLPEAAAMHTHQGHRAMDGQRAMQLTSDPFLGYTSIEGRDYLVRQLNDHKASLDLTKLTPASLLGYADLCGELFARGHARAGDPVALSAYLGTSARFDHALLAFAHTYADKTEHDWELLKKKLHTSRPAKASKKK
jgi:uncharacterized protein (DUF2252 family)